MFDQSFSVKNFRAIYNQDRKNKGDIEKDYFPEAYELRLKIRLLKKTAKKLAFRHKYKGLPRSKFEKKKKKIKEILKLRRDTLNYEINQKLDLIVRSVSSKGYALPLKKSSLKIKKKDIYSVGNDIETIFVSRHIQLILSSLYKVKVNNRDLIISRLGALIRDASPKYVVRADVENFYESIDHNKLLDILHSSPKLSVTPRKILTRLIDSYAKLTGVKKGLPRGVGVSAYLSEIYMGEIDYEITSLPDVTYFERYVDDIVVIFSPTKSIHTTNYFSSIDGIISKRSLSLNDKTKELDLYNSHLGNFEYLGYKFIVDQGGCKIRMSKNKVDKIKKRIDKSFDHYNNKIKSVPNVANNGLLLRIKFLTSNTRLLNGKSNAFVGVYFSNKFITDTSDLNSLDCYLKHKLSLLPNSRLKKRLLKMSFLKGYENRIFRRFTIANLSSISKGWKNG